MRIGLHSQRIEWIDDGAGGKIKVQMVMWNIEPKFLPIIDCATCALGGGWVNSGPNDGAINTCGHIHQDPRGVSFQNSTFWDAWWRDYLPDPTRGYLLKTNLAPGGTGRVEVCAPADWIDSAGHTIDTRGALCGWAAWVGDHAETGPPR